MRRNVWRVWPVCEDIIQINLKYTYMDLRLWAESKSLRAGFNGELL